jgi:hypothetical protein
MTLTHWFAHRLSWNHGNVVAWSAGDDVMVGFRCLGCGKLSGVHIAPRYLWQT